LEFDSLKRLTKANLSKNKLTQTNNIYALLVHRQLLFYNTHIFT